MGIPAMKSYPRNEDHKPGTWKPLRTHNGMSAMFTCPKCYTLGCLDTHGIKNTGEVWPSVVCPNEGCDFHETIQLEGWPPDNPTNGAAA